MENRKPRRLWIYLLILLGGYIYGSPYITLFLIKRSIESRSVQNIERFVDFSKVRDSLKSQLTNHLQEEASKDQGSPEFAQFAAGMGTAFGSTLIDSLVQPSNVQKWLNGDKASDLQDIPNLPTPSSLANPDNSVSLGYTSFDTFEVALKNPQGLNAIILERRNIVNWKVVSIILDKSLFVNQKSASMREPTPEQSSHVPSTNVEVDYVHDGPGGHFYVLKNGQLYYSDEHGASTKPEGKPEVISPNILKIKDFYYCRWESYAETQVAQFGGGPWICTASGLAPNKYVY